MIAPVDSIAIAQYLLHLYRQEDPTFLQLAEDGSINEDSHIHFQMTLYHCIGNHLILRGLEGCRIPLPTAKFVCSPSGPVEDRVCTMIKEGTLFPAENNDKITRYVWENCQKRCNEKLVNDSKSKGTVWKKTIKITKDKKGRPEITFETFTKRYTKTMLEKKIMFYCGEKIPEFFGVNENEEQE